MRSVLPRDPVRRAHLAARFWAKVKIPKADAATCWRWRAGATFQLDARRCASPERVAFALVYGDPGGAVRRTCRTPNCVRPDHLITWRMLAARIRALRERGLTQVEVGKRVGRCLGTVSRLECRARKAA